MTRKSFDESLKKASDALEKAQEAYDDAPIGKEDKAEVISASALATLSFSGDTTLTC